jgi:LAS superfamily LD-carboxypeptidase LdcB
MLEVVMPTREAAARTHEHGGAHGDDASEIDALATHSGERAEQKQPDENEVRQAETLVAEARADEPAEKCGVGRLRHRHPPKTTVRVQGHGKTVLLHPDAAAAYQRLLAHARQDGFEAPLFEIDSGYRSHAHQAMLWANAVKKGSPQLRVGHA